MWAVPLLVVGILPGDSNPFSLLVDMFSRERERERKRLEMLDDLINASATS